MAYDTKKVIERYAQIEAIPEGEPEQSDCPLINGDQPGSDPMCPLEGCRSCCVGAVEVVRQVHAQQVELETCELTLADTLTRASDIQREK